MGDKHEVTMTAHQFKEMQDELLLMADALNPYVALELDGAVGGSWTA